MTSQQLEGFKSKTEALRNIVTSVALGIAGIWALFNFFSLRQSALAEASLRESEQRLTQWTAVEAKIEARQLIETSTENLTILAEVELTNKGKRPARLVYKPKDAKLSGSNPAIPQIAVAKVEFREDGSPQFTGERQAFDSSIKSSLLNIPARKLSMGTDDLSNKDREVVTWQLLRVGPTYTLPFVVRVPDPGLYFVDFRVRIGEDPQEQEVFKKEFGRNRPSATLSGSTFVYVSAAASDRIE